jgi:hypothetical protein
MKGLHLVCRIGRQLFAGLPAITILLVLTVTRDARADVLTFAQFTEQAVSDQSFFYSNNTTNVSFGSLSGGIPIFLTITDGFAPSLNRVEAARLYLSSNSTATATAPVPPDQFTQQHITGPGNLLQIILDTPVNGKTNFLTATFSDALFSGRLNSTEASLKTLPAVGGDPAKVTFTSDFIDFTDATEAGLSLSLSSVISTDGSGDLQMAENGFLKSFTASGTGTFDTNFAGAPVPEPSNLILAGFGLLGLLGWAWKQGWLRH